MAKRYGWTKRVLTNFVEAQTYEKYLLNQTNFDLTLPAERRVQAKLAVKDEYTFAALKGKLTFYPANLEFFLYTPFLYFSDSYPHLWVALIPF